MALALLNRDPDSRLDVKGSRRTAQFRATFDADYPTGGYAVSAESIGLSRLDSVNVSGATSAGKLAFYDHATGKLQVFTAAGAEVANLADLTGESVDIQITGV